MSTLTAYRTAPQKEHDAAAELRQSGRRAYVPRQRRRRPSPFTGRFWPVAPGYVFSDAAVRAAWDKHVRGSIGQVTPDELSRLYEGRKPEKITANKFQPGDLVGVRKGPLAEVTGVVDRPRKSGYLIKVEMFGKCCSVFVPQRYLYHVTRPG